MYKIFSDCQSGCELGAGQSEGLSPIRQVRRNWLATTFWACTEKQMGIWVLLTEDLKIAADFQSSNQTHPTN